MLSDDEFMRRLHRCDLTTWLAIMQEPLPTGPLPELITLYRRDVKRWLDGRWLADSPLLHAYLSLPLAIACQICADRPTFWQELPDFVQCGNLELLLAIEQAYEDHATFKAYVAKRITGVIYGCFTQTHIVYIPPTTRHRHKRKGNEEAFVSFDRMESFDVLLDEVEREIDIAAEECASPEEAEQKRLLVAQLLAQLPEKERQSLVLRYGIDERKHNNPEIGKILGVSAEHVRILCNQALQRLRGETKKRAREDLHRQKLERDAKMQAVVDEWEKQGKYGSIQELMQETGYTWNVAAKFLATYRKQIAKTPVSVSGIPASALANLRETEAILNAQGRKLSFQALQRTSGVDPRYATAYLLKEVTCS